MDPFVRSVLNLMRRRDSKTEDKYSSWCKNQFTEQIKRSRTNLTMTIGLTGAYPMKCLHAAFFFQHEDTKHNEFPWGLGEDMEFIFLCLHRHSFTIQKT
jgi:hypothetical protein